MKQHLKRGLILLLACIAALVFTRLLPAFADEPGGQESSENTDVSDPGSGTGDTDPTNSEDPDPTDPGETEPTSEEPPAPDLSELLRIDAALDGDPVGSGSPISVKLEKRSTLALTISYTGEGGPGAALTSAALSDGIREIPLQGGGSAFPYNFTASLRYTEVPESALSLHFTAVFEKEDGSGTVTIERFYALSVEKKAAPELKGAVTLHYGEGKALSLDISDAADGLMVFHVPASEAGSVSVCLRSGVYTAVVNRGKTPEDSDFTEFTGGSVALDPEKDLVFGYPETATTAAGETIRVSVHLTELVGRKSPTCTEEGWNAYEQCPVKDCGYTTKVTLPAQGHSYTAWLYQGDGRHVRRCVRLDHEESGACVMGSWFVEQEPGPGVEGVMARTCAICSGKERQMIPALETTSEEPTTEEPTTEEPTTEEPTTEEPTTEAPASTEEPTVPPSETPERETEPEPLFDLGNLKKYALIGAGVLLLIILLIVILLVSMRKDREREEAEEKETPEGKKEPESAGEAPEAPAEAEVKETPEAPAEQNVSETPEAPAEPPANEPPEA